MESIVIRSVVHHEAPDVQITAHVGEAVYSILVFVGVGIVRNMFGGWQNNTFSCNLSALLVVSHMPKTLCPGWQANACPARCLVPW